MRTRVNRSTTSYGEKMDSGSFFNKVWVIESLPEGDLKTGTSLVEGQLEEAKAANPELIVAFEQPKTKHDLLNVLEKIKTDTLSTGCYPMIHFECHGCPDGLGTAANELVTWDELRKVLIEINQACRLNLVIVLACCNGAYLIKAATKMDRAPFWAIIGPEVEVTAGEVLIEFREFYKIFFETMNGDAAIDALNKGVARPGRKYHFLSAAGLFIRAYTRYYRRFCTGKGLRERTETLTTEAMKNPNVRLRGVKWARSQVKCALAAKDANFNKIKNRFFFIELFPENKERFPLTHDSVLKKTQP
jgi:hypothetical protein